MDKKYTNTKNLIDLVDIKMTYEDNGLGDLVYSEHSPSLSDYQKTLDSNADFCVFDLSLDNGDFRDGIIIARDANEALLLVLDSISFNELFEYEFNDAQIARLGVAFDKTPKIWNYH